jgi:HlyD family secretion protein
MSTRLSIVPVENGEGLAPQAPAQPAPVLRPPTRWHDPLRLIEGEAPSRMGRVVLRVVCALILVLLLWAMFGRLDIVATASGKLVPQTLVKIVQPMEAGVVTELLVAEGDLVKAGQVLARLDTTVARADKIGIATDLTTQQMQIRRIEAELADRPYLPHKGDDPVRFAQIQQQYAAHRRAFMDSEDQEQSMLRRAELEKRSAGEILQKLETTLPTYSKIAESYAKLEKAGFVGGLAMADKEREAIEKSKDRDAQVATVAALDATIDAQQKKIRQLRSAYRNELERELADLRARVAQLQQGLDKSAYRERLLELRAPQDGVIKDLATTTIGAVVQAGSVVVTLVPQGEQLFADVSLRNDDVGFVRIGQPVQLKFAAYPFQQYGMATGTVVRVSADSLDQARQGTSVAGGSAGPELGEVYRVRVGLNDQSLRSGSGAAFPLSSGMALVAEIHQGKRTVLEYLLDPVRKTVNEAARER